MSTGLAEREVRMVWKGPVSEFLLDTTRHIDLEGAFRSGKTTVALWKVLTSCLDHPGIAWLICRYGDGDTQSKLKPPWRAICEMAGVVPSWDPHALCDTLPNGSKVYIFGIKAQDQVTRYAKLRGITLAGIYNDQTEELPKDVFQEFMGRLSQNHYPHQLLLTPNPPDENHWLAEEFPEDNHIPGRKYYTIPIHANSHNLPAETIRSLEEAYPPSHAKHRSAVLGKRGLNVIGEPVYKGAFIRSLHERPLAFNPDLPLLEAIDFGKHHPCVVWAQYTPYSQLHLLGGVMGQNLYLEDFAPVIKQYRAQWFPNPLEVMTCCDPAGSHNNSQGVMNNGVKVLQEHEFYPRWQENSNSPAVRVAMVERLAGYMRKRTPMGEAFGVDNSRWVRVGSNGASSWKFLTDGFEAGYVWDEHMVSVGSKQMRKPKKDGWFEHGQNCTEYLELNFGGSQPTQMQNVRAAEKMQRLQERARYDVDPAERRVVAYRQRAGLGRGGYR